MIALADLEKMDRVALTDTWSRIMGCPVPKGLSKPFLRRFLAYEIQARRSGGLPKGFIAQLRAKAKDKSRPTSPTLRPGGRLVREWNGKTHLVEVTDSGFVWNNQPYRSLSAVAREITGARWSGPRFFGLTRAVDT